MPRIRTVKPMFWSDEKVCELPRPARLTLLGIISAMADDEGRAKANPRVVRAAVYPLDEDVTSAEVAEHLDAIERLGIVRRYEVSGERYLVVTNWSRHQKIDRPSKSQLPQPPDDSSSDRRAPDEPSRLSGAERRGKEGERERKRSGAEEGAGAPGTGGRATPRPATPPAPPAVARAADAAGSPAPLPRGAEAWLATFYGAASEERRAAVREELEHALNGGAEFRRKPVRATPERLDVECARMVRERARVRKPDGAIAILFAKLTEDPETNPAGRTVTEQRSHDEHAREQREEEYQRYARAQVGAWMRAHPDDARPIAEAVDGEIRERGQDPESPLWKPFREAQLVARCRDPAGVASFDEWAGLAAGSPRLSTSPREFSTHGGPDA